MKLKDLLVEAVKDVDSLSFGSADAYHLVIYFNETISDKDAERKAIKKAIKDDATEEGFGALISDILSLYDQCGYALTAAEESKGNAKKYANEEAAGYRSEFTKHGKTLKVKLQDAIEAGKIPGIDTKTKVSKIEHPL